MRTPILMLAGLLAVTVPLQPAHAATCSVPDTGSCAEFVYATVDTAVAAANSVADNLCDDGVDSCGDYVGDRVQDEADSVEGRVQTVLGIVEQACDGDAIGPCLERILCGGPSVSYCTATANQAIQAVVDQVEAACGGSTATCDDTVLADAGAAAGLVLGTYQGAADHDADGVPDALESEICGRAAVRDLVDGHSPFTGACVSSADYAPPASGTYTDVVLALAAYAVAQAESAVAQAVDTANSVVDYATFLAGFATRLVEETAGDHDHDGIPDDREPLVCGLENQNDPTDGSCVDGDYTGPL